MWTKRNGRRRQAAPPSAKLLESRGNTGDWKPRATYPRYTSYPQVESALRDSESMRASIRGRQRTTGNGRKLQPRSHDRQSKDPQGSKPRKTWRAMEGRSARQRLRPMPNPLSESSPAEPEPSGEGTANRDPIGTAVPIGDRKRVEARCKPEGSPTGTDRGRKASAGTGLGTRQSSDAEAGNPSRKESGRKVPEDPAPPKGQQALPSQAKRTFPGKWGLVATPAPITLWAPLLSPHRPAPKSAAQARPSPPGLAVP
jgi:hypothetical protein